jgi:hypothetical protein
VPGRSELKTSRAPACRSVRHAYEPLDAQRTEPRAGPRHVFDGVRRLHRRDDAKRREARDVGARDHLRMLDAVACRRGRRYRASRVFEEIQDRGVRRVADGVHRDLKAGLDPFAFGCGCRTRGDALDDVRLRCDTDQTDALQRRAELEQMHVRVNEPGDDGRGCGKGDGLCARPSKRRALRTRSRNRRSCRRAPRQLPRQGATGRS